MQKKHDTSKNVQTLKDHLLDHISGSPLNSLSLAASDCGELHVHRFIHTVAFEIAATFSSCLALRQLRATRSRAQRLSRTGARIATSWAEVIDEGEPSQSTVIVSTRCAKVV